MILVKMTKDVILDPLWITKGSYLDPEYFTYILLAASQKYRKEIEEEKMDHFYEVLFHNLNLNNLTISGTIFNFKMKPHFDNPRIKEIRDHLKKVYEIPKETLDIFRNANYIFSNLLLDYMDLQLDILDNVKIYHGNRRIHLEKEIFIVTNKAGELNYTVWSLKFTKRKDFGFTFNKIIEVVLPELKENALKETIDSLALPELKDMLPNKNVCFGITQEDLDKTNVASVLKDLLLLNRGIAKDLDFEPRIIDELHKMIFNEKIMPFALNQWF